MPADWWYGDWYVAHSSNTKYQASHDLVWSLSPVCGLAGNDTLASYPLGSFTKQTNDLLTWFTNSSSTTYVSASGYDTPRRVNNASAGLGWVNTFDTVGAGTLSYFQNCWQVLAWCYDSQGSQYMLNYETAVLSDETPAFMVILSREAGGPGEAVVQAIGKAVEGLENEDLRDLFPKMQGLPHDDRRELLPPFVCGSNCVNNTDSSAGNI